MIRVDETDPVGEVEPSFPYRDVTVRRCVDFNEQYDIQSEIGRGKFGTVYQCKEKSSGLVLAAKVVTTTRKEDRRSVEREVEIMRRLQHPRLIQLYDAIDNGKQIYVILEMIQGGELFERVIDDDFLLTERSCAVFMRQICEGIEFVHAQHILHLDMKPENILCLTKEGNRIKIIDFGLARHYDPRKKMQVLFGTPEFVAPEVVNFDQIGFGTDMWSIGVICYVLLSGLSPFMGDTDVETMANVTIAKYDFDHDAFADISEDAKDFIRCLLVKDKEKRATATMCRSHRWLAIKPPTRTKIEAKATTPSKTTTARTKEDKSTTRKDQVTQETRSNASMRNELDVTKDNLRLFVERWREHPDSPYLFETLDQQANNGGDNFAPRISSLDDRQATTSQSNDCNLELVSLRGQSPSPCGSVCTTSSEMSEACVDKSNFTLAVPNSVMLGLERRASEGFFPNAKGHRMDQASQIVLAEEIIKLSEHLRNLAMGQHTEAQKNQDQATSTPRLKVVDTSTKGIRDNDDTSRKNVEKKSSVDKRNGKKSSSRDTENDANESNEISEKLSSITRQRKINGTTFNGNRSYEKQESTVASFTLKKTRNGSRKIDDGEISSNERASIVKEKEINASKRNDNVDGRSRVTWKDETDYEISENDAERHLTSDDCTNYDNHNRATLGIDREVDLIPPWRRARAKRRFGETCRDVPRISSLRDLHKNLNLDEPKTTKDLLLHLLGEWDDSARPGGGIGRKSISVDWCSGEESVARRSMNSLAEYFQSEQQKSSTTTSLTTNSTSTSSVHR